MTLEQLRQVMVPAQYKSAFAILIDIAEAAIKWEEIAVKRPDCSYPERRNLQVMVLRLRDFMEPPPCRHRWCLTVSRTGVVCDLPGCGKHIDLPEVGE